MCEGEKEGWGRRDRECVHIYEQVAGVSVRGEGVREGEREEEGGR